MSDSEKPAQPTGPWIARHALSLAVGLVLAAGALIPVGFLVAQVIIPRVFAERLQTALWQAGLLDAVGIVSPVLVLLATGLTLWVLVRPPRPRVSFIRKVLVIGGTVLGGIWLASIPRAMADRERSGLIQAACASHVAGLTRALHEYLADHHGTLPVASTWCDDLRPYVESEAVFVCPAAPKLRCGYAYNAALSGLRYDDIEDADGIVAFFESDAGWNDAGGPELLPEKPRHRRADLYAWTGGNVELHLRRGASDLQWRPALKERPEDAPAGP